MKAKDSYDLGAKWALDAPAHQKRFYDGAQPDDFASATDAFGPMERFAIRRHELLDVTWVRQDAIEFWEDIGVPVSTLRNLSEEEQLELIAEFLRGFKEAYVPGLDSEGSTEYI